MTSRLELASTLATLAPPCYNNRLVVAGSYGTYPERAEDIDLWLLDVTVSPERVLLRRELEKHWKTLGVWYSLHSKSDPRYVDSHFDVVATLYAGLDRPVQFITTQCVTLMELLKKFDISTHCGGFYLNNPKERLLGVGFTPCNQTPRVLNFERDPQLTKNRLLNICERYDHLPHPKDLTKLDDLIECPF